MSAAAALEVYDSSRRYPPLVTELRNFWRYRGLVRLLVTRDLTVRYKRSVLGVSWTLLNPMLTTAVMWVIFSQIFRFPSGDVPYIVYLLSGILTTTYFSQGVVASGGAVIHSSPILTKVYVPGEIFSLSAVVAAATNFSIGLVPLLVVQLATGVGIPWTVVLVPLPVIALLLFITGLGLLVASAAVYFYDVIDATGVVVQLIAYLTPSFYPVEIVPDHLQFLVEANPLYSHLRVLRSFVYEGSFPPGATVAAMALSAIASFVVGVLVFSRAWKRLVVLL